MGRLRKAENHWRWVSPFRESPSRDGKPFDSFDFWRHNETPSLTISGLKAVRDYWVTKHVMIAR
jgi:hypothetical protein